MDIGIAALVVSSSVSELPVGLARKSLCCAGIVTGQYCKKNAEIIFSQKCWVYIMHKVLFPGQLCIALGLDQQSFVIEQLQQTEEFRGV